MCVSVFHAYTYAGEKFSTFSGNITSLNDENRNLVVKNSNNKEVTFFVAGEIVQGTEQITLEHLSKGCVVTVTYQKNKGRYIASKVAAAVCQHVER